MVFEMDQIRYAITAITVIVGLSLVALYLAPAVFTEYGQLVVGLAIGSIAGLAGNTITKQ